VAKQPPKKPNDSKYPIQPTDYEINDKQLSLEDRIDKISWNDVILDPKVKYELQSYATGIACPETYSYYGLDPVRNLLLIGEPGTGKTISVKAMASENNFDLLVIKTSDITDMWYGESERKMQEAFNQARKISEENQRTCVLYFDEIDSIAEKRDTSHEATRRVTSVLLQNMDGIEKKGNVYVVASTNRVESLDPALTRPGRFDLILKVDVPKYEQLVQLYEHYVQKVRTKAKKDYLDPINCQELAVKSKGFTGADVEFIVKKTCSDKMWKDYNLEYKMQDTKLVSNDFIRTIAEYDPTRGGSKGRGKIIKGFGG